MSIQKNSLLSLISSHNLLVMIIIIAFTIEVSVSWKNTGHLIIADIIKKDLLKSNQHVYDLVSDFSKIIEKLNHHDIKTFEEATTWPDELKRNYFTYFDSYHSNILKFNYTDYLIYLNETNNCNELKVINNMSFYDNCNISSHISGNFNSSTSDIKDVFTSYNYLNNLDLDLYDTYFQDVKNPSNSLDFIVRE